ncbi:MAG: carboxypeptidase regulatory-like domain-containing protein, partial [Saprospiraceae bacterium]|nr:carboxypeptidase regulatory-like domain-containing protein [Saprospiraceae bacterium]
MKTLLLLLFGLSAASLLTAQTSLQGKVTDAESGEPIIFGSVILEKEGVYIAGVQTDFDGNYSISKLDPGTYDVECTYVGYLSVTVEGVVVKAGTANRLDIQMTASVALDEVEVIAYKVPLIERDNTTTGSVISADRINRLPQRK